MSKGEKRRRKACKLAAMALGAVEVDSYAPHIWSLAVFFEWYMELGSEATLKDFGPKKPKKARVLKLVPKTPA